MAIVATLALLVLWRPAVVHAQEATASPPPPAPASAQPPATKPSASPAVATARTHVVRAGETLWGLAARYYGDGHAWTQLARSNNIATDGNKPPLEVGMTLRVPVSKKVAGTKAAAVAAAPADSTVPKVALARAGEGTLPAPSAAPAKTAKAAGKAPAGSLAAQTAGKGSVEKTPTNTSAPAPAKSGDAAAPQVTAVPVSTPATESDKADFERRKQTVMTRDGAVRIGLVTSQDQSASRKASEVQTVFHRDLPDAAEAERRTSAVLRPNTPVARQGELDAAPFVMTDAELAAAGTIRARVGAPAPLLDPAPERVLRDDFVELMAVGKTTFTVGQRLKAFAVTPGPTKGRRVAVPTGMVEVTSVTGAGRAIAQVHAISGRLESGQYVIPASGEPAPRVLTEKLSAPDIATTILWLDPAQSLPSLQCYLVLSAGASKGVKAGDEFGLYYRPPSGPEVQTALVRVVRVDGEHSTAVIMQQFGAQIGQGMPARRVAKAP